MPRRFNYTNRKKIASSDYTIELVQDKGGLSFRAELDLTSYRLDPRARVFIEAYKSVSTLWKRFDFGRVGIIIPPADRSLQEFGQPESVRFRIKVTAVGEDAGRLLAEADRITPRLPGDPVEVPHRPLISTEPGNIGDEIWRVHFEDEPVLVINERIEDWKALAHSPVFKAIALPAVMRQVLTRILLIDRLDRDEDDPDEWRTRWITFAESLTGVPECPGPLDNLEQNQAAVEGWIDQCVEALTARIGSLATIQSWQTREITS
jgi:hypothetical protein